MFCNYLSVKMRVQTGNRAKTVDNHTVSFESPVDKTCLINPGRALVCQPRLLLP
jgi:hypothetical protein